MNLTVATYGFRLWVAARKLCQIARDIIVIAREAHRDKALQQDSAEARMAGLAGFNNTMQAALRQAEEEAAARSAEARTAPLKRADYIFIAFVAAVVMFAPPHNVSKEHPLKQWKFKVPLPRKQVAKYLVNDYQQTAIFWVDGVTSVSSVGRQGYHVKTVQFDMLSAWSKTGDFTWEETNKFSPLFLAAADRPSAAQITASPGMDWAVEWKLLETSPAVTEVVRTIFEFKQHSNYLLQGDVKKWMMQRWVVQRMMMGEMHHGRMVKNFVARAK